VFHAGGYAGYARKNENVFIKLVIDKGRPVGLKLVCKEKILTKNSNKK
jgi:hypothetical protein